MPSTPPSTPAVAAAAAPLASCCARRMFIFLLYRLPIRVATHCDLRVARAFIGGISQNFARTLTSQDQAAVCLRLKFGQPDCLRAKIETNDARQDGHGGKRSETCWQLSPFCFPLERKYSPSASASRGKSLREAKLRYSKSNRGRFERRPIMHAVENERSGVKCVYRWTF